MLNQRVMEVCLGNTGELMAFVCDRSVITFIKNKIYKLSSSEIYY